MIDGRSVAPGGLGGDSSVDLGVIPMAMIERIELSPTGDAARHGSGAIGGTVEIITRKHFDGTETSLSTGTSSHGDGSRWDVSMITGTSSSRGSLTFAAGFARQGAVSAGERQLSISDQDYDYANGAVLPYVGSSVVPQGRLDTRALDSDGDGVADAPIDICGLTPAGVPIRFCTADFGGWRPFSQPGGGDVYNYQFENHLVTPAQRASFVATGERKLRGVRGFFEAWYVASETEQQLAPELFVDAAEISPQSIYNPLGVRILGYTRRLIELGHRRAQEDSDTVRLVLGVSGELPLREGSWELTYNLGRTQTELRQEGHFDSIRLGEALGPSFLDANGVARCGTPGDVLAGCVPVNLLAGGYATPLTSAMRQYLAATALSSGENQQQVLALTAAGQLATTPGNGHLSLTSGVELRRDSGDFAPDERILAGNLSTGSEPVVSGHTDAASIYAALSLVPVANLDSIHRAQLDLTARASRYDGSGNSLSGTAAALVHLPSDLVLRASFARAFRAPSLRERFNAPFDSLVAIDDPCGASVDLPVPAEVLARCAEQGVPPGTLFDDQTQVVMMGGTEDLEQERADVLLAGVTWQPRWVRQLELSAQYFRTEVSNVIQQIGGADIVLGCYFRGIDELCDRVYRDPNLGDGINFIDNRTTNTGSITTAGIDLSLAYRHALRRHQLAYRFDSTYLLQHDVAGAVTTRDAVAVYDLGVFPRLKANLAATWSYGRVAAGGSARFLSGFDECADNDCHSLRDEDEATRDQLSREVSAQLTFDGFASYELESRAGVTTLRFGVNNVRDEAPPAIYAGFAGNSDSSTYDYLGRFFYMRMTQAF